MPIELNKSGFLGIISYKGRNVNISGEKVLYDINPIKMVEQSVKPDTSTTKDSVSQEKPIVNTKIENSQKNLNQDRLSDEESFSNRSILANALASTVQHEVEQKKLDE